MLTDAFAKLLWSRYVSRGMCMRDKKTTLVPSLAGYNSRDPKKIKA